MREFLKGAKGRVFPRRHIGEELRGSDSGAGRSVLRGLLKRLKNRFSASLLTQGLAATIALHTTSALLLLGVFLFVQGRALERQLELRGESMAQFLANELQFALLVGDRDEARRVLESSANEDILFLEVLNPAGQRICALDRPARPSGNPYASPGAAMGKGGIVLRNDGAGYVEIRMPVSARLAAACSIGSRNAGTGRFWAFCAWESPCKSSAPSSARCCSAEPASSCLAWR